MISKTVGSASSRFAERSYSICQYHATLNGAGGSPTLCCPSVDMARHAVALNGWQRSTSGLVHARYMPALAPLAEALRDDMVAVEVAEVGCVTLRLAAIIKSSRKAARLWRRRGVEVGTRDDFGKDFQLGQLFPVKQKALYYL